MSQFSFLTASQVRRLPVYLLLDCSSSMTGEPIKAVNDGLQMIHDELIKDPRTLETVHLCVICFASDAGVVFPLDSIDNYQPQTVFANGQTAMGQAFHLLADSIDRDLRVNTGERKGDYRPIVYLLSDGQPTDEYDSGIQRLSSFADNKRPMIIALACGPKADMQMLRKLTHYVYKAAQADGETIRKFFQWISGSITQTSRTVTNSPDQPARIDDPTDIPGITYEPE